MVDGAPASRWPRPVAGVPPVALADGEAVAKAWLLELLGAVPLEVAAAIPVADLAARGPALCAALLDAIGAEDGLERVRPGGDRHALAAGAGELAGAADPAAAAGAVAALRRALWAAVLAELPRPDAAGVAALAERVQHVADVVTAAVLAPPIADVLRDVEEPALVAVERRLELHRRDGAAFAVLAVEADDAERLRAAGGADADALRGVEAAVRGAVRRGDAVAREPGERLWVLAPGLDAAPARGLAEDVAAAVAAAAAPHGAPLRAAVGVATCPADGADARTLLDRADERLFAARAAGRPVT
jgi:diguanylate cyclase (GGDEF)-like protein